MKDEDPFSIIQVENSLDWDDTPKPWYRPMEHTLVLFTVLISAAYLSMQVGHHAVSTCFHLVVIGFHALVSKSPASF